MAMVQVFCIQWGVDLHGVHLNGSTHLTQRCELNQLVGCRLHDLDSLSVRLEDVIVGCESCQDLRVLSKSNLHYFILYIHMGDIKKACHYRLALGTSLDICHPNILNDSVLTGVQIPDLCHMHAFSLLIFSDGIRGLADPLNSVLTRKITMSLASSVCNLCQMAFHKPPATHRRCASS